MNSERKGLGKQKVDSIIRLLSELTGTSFDSQRTPSEFDDLMVTIFTEIKLLKQELLDSETNREFERQRAIEYSQLIENMMEAITHPFYIIDANDYTLKLRNSAADKYGAAINTRTCYALTHNRATPCDPGEHPCPLLETKKTKKPVVLEHVHFDRDGNERNVEVHGYPILDKEGKVTQMIEYCLDITEKKREHNELVKTYQELVLKSAELEGELKKEEKLRDQLIVASKFASLGEMSAKITHEINNPLTVIMAQAQIQKTQVEDENCRESFDLIYEKSLEVRKLTRSYMDLGKQNDTEMTNISMGEVLRKTVESMHSLKQLKMIEFSEEYTKNEPEIFGDANKLEQVFRNLIINSIHAITGLPNGKISLGTRIINGGDRVEVFIKDNGHGIKSEDLDKVFDIYYTTKKDGIGTGLGLAISKEIINVTHGGRIEIESKEGVGTTVHVILPISEMTQKKKKVLVIDDDLSILILIAEFLADKGFTVRTSNDAEKGFEIYRNFNPDVVLCDVNMPGTDGFVIFERIKREIPSQAFVMITDAFLKPEELSLLNQFKVPQIIKPPDLENELLPVLESELQE